MSYDILIFQGVEPVDEQKITLALGNPGAFTTGIQKVAQSFTKIFLTELGSMDHDPTLGTNFLSALRQGLIRDEVTLQGAFQTAVMDVFNYISLNEDPTIPDDERLVEANLAKWDLRPGFLSIEVEIVTAAGDTRIYVIPVETRIAT